MTGRRGLLGALVCALIFMMLSPSIALAAPASSKKVVVVLLDGFKLSDISRGTTPNLWRMGEVGAMGVMNHIAHGPKNQLNAYLTLSAGARAGVPHTSPAATSGNPLIQAYAAKERIPGESHPTTGRDLYVRHTGEEPQGNIQFPHLPKIREQAANNRFAAQPGKLGQAVHELGGRTAVFGSSDLGEQPHRPAVLLAMDERGLVDEGDLQAGKSVDPSHPYGLHTDMLALYHRYQKSSGHAQLLILDTGDLSRLHAVRDLMDDAKRESAYQQTLEEADFLVGKLLPEASPDTLLAVLSPTKHPDPEAPALSPVLLAGGEIEPGTLLTSSTTKREGLIANYDLTPTFIKHLGGEVGSYHLQGQPVTTKPITAGRLKQSDLHPAQTADHLALRGMTRDQKPPVSEQLEAPASALDASPSDQALTGTLSARPNSREERTDHAAVSSYEQLTVLVQQMLVPSLSRQLLVRPWLNTWIGLAGLLLLTVFFRRTRWIGVLLPFAEVLLIFPLTWLYVPLLQPGSVQDTVLFSLIGTLGIWAFLQGIRRPLHRLGLLAGVTAATLMLDMLFGAPLLRQSLFSYDPIVGARYYGIGNEYMGVLLGALLLAVSLLERIRRRTGRGNRLAWLLFACAIFLFAAPTFGTNAGGAMAAAVGCTYALLHLRGQPLAKKRVVLYGGIAFLGALLILFALNIALPDAQQTHIGRVAQDLLGGRFAEVGNIILRKLELNFHLLRVSAWGKLFLLFLAFYGLWYLRHREQGDGDDHTRFLLQNGNRLLVAALAALLFNDSGVVAAALILLYAVVPLLGTETEAVGHTSH